MRFMALLALTMTVGCGDKDEDDTGDTVESTDDTGTDEVVDPGPEGELYEDYELLDSDGDLMKISDTDGAIRIILGTAAW